MKKRVVWGSPYHQKFQLHSNTIYTKKKMKKKERKKKLPVFGKKNRNERKK